MNLVQHYHQEPHTAEGDIRLIDLQAIIRRRSLTIGATVLSCLTIGIAVTFLMHKSWQGQAQMVMVQPSLPNGAASTQYNTGSLLQTIETVETQLGMLQSDAMASRAVTWLKREAAINGKASNSVTLDADTLSRNLTVVNPKNSSVLNVSVKAPNPDQAALWTNAVCSAFVEWKSEVSEHSARTAAHNLATQAMQSKLLSQHADAALAAFKLRYRIVDPAEQHHNALSMVHARESDVEALTEQLVSDDARIAVLKHQIRFADKSIRTGTGVRDDTLVLSLQTQLSALQAQRSEAATQFTPYFPGVLHGIDSRIDAANKRLSQAIQGTLDNKRPSLQDQGALIQALKDAEVEKAIVKSKLNSAVALRSEQQASIADIPLQDMNLAQLQHAADLAAAQYLNVKAALNQAQLQLAQVTQNIQVTQWATPPLMPASPNPVLNIAASLAIGLLLAAVITAWKELVDGRLHTVAAVQRIGSQPVICLLPKLSLGQRSQLRRRAALPQLEAAINQARGNMSLLDGRATNGETSWAYAPQSLESLGSQMERPQVLLVTSASPGEGKSFVAAQLALSLSQAGKNVTIVDANPQRPAVGALWTTGASALQDAHANSEHLEDALRRSDQARLTTLRGADFTGTSADFFSPQGLMELIDELQQKSDVVIFDGPDCVSTREVVALASVSDLIVHVVRIDGSEAEAVADGAAILAGMRKPVGIVINGATKSDRAHYRNRPLLVPMHETTAQRELGTVPGQRDTDLQANGTDDASDGRRPSGLSIIKTS